MKYLRWTYICFALISSSAWGQFNLVPIIGINTTKINYGGSFEKGGSFGLAGMEIEYKWRFKKHKKVMLGLHSGVSYLKNGFYSSYSFAYIALDYYSQNITDLKTEYVQVPLVCRLYYQPAPLLEEWQLFIGAGIFQSFLLNSSLYEKNTLVFYNSDPLAPAVTTIYEDSGNITEFGNKQSYFRRIEVGMNYKKFMVAFRLNKSLEDMMHKGLENTWEVPDQKSGYISSYQSDGRIDEKHIELIIGLRLGR